MQKQLCRCALILALLHCMLPDCSLAQEDQWRLYTNTWDVREVIETDNDYWSFSHNGIVRFDKNDPAKLEKFSPLITVPAMGAFTAAAIDGAGVVWVGTFNGSLYSYDGSAWQHHELTSSENQPLERITALHSDRQGRLWVAASGKYMSLKQATVFRRENGEFMRLTQSSEFGLLEVRQFASVGDEVVWATGIDGQKSSRDVFVLRFEGSAIERFDKANGFEMVSSGDPVSFVIDADASPWLINRDSIAHFTAGKWEFTATNTKGLPSYLGGMTADFNGRVRVYSSRSIYEEIAGEWQALDVAEHIGQENWITGMHYESDGTLWLATPAGVARISGGESQFFTTADGLPVNRVNNFTSANGGGVVCETTLGLAVYKGAQWSIVRNANEPLGNSILDFDAADKDNVCLVADNFAGYSVNILQDGFWRGFDLAAIGLADSVRLYNIAFDKSGGVWVGHTVGVSHFDGSEWTLYTIQDTLQPYREFHDMLVDGDKLWVTSSADYPVGITQNGTPVIRPIIQLHSFAAGVWQSYGEEEGLDTRYSPLVNLCKDSKGRIWAAQKYANFYNNRCFGGLFRVDGEEVVKFDLQRPAVDLDIYPDEINVSVEMISCDAHDRIWVAYGFAYPVHGGTLSGGLSVFDGADFFHLDELDLWPDKHGVVFSVASNRKGDIFFSGSAFPMGYIRGDSPVGMSCPLNDLAAKMQCPDDGSIWRSGPQESGIACLAGVVTSVGEPDGTTAQSLTLTLSPNPLITTQQSVIELRVDTPSATPLRVRLYDLRGLPIPVQATSSRLNAAELSVRLEIPELPSGAYIVRVEQAGHTASEVLTVRR